MKKAIIFSGIKHSGKTVFARKISALLSLPFFDTDDFIKKRNNLDSIREFYIEKGKEEFMKEELSCYLSLPSPPFVLSLGGGASDNTALMERIKKDGNLLVYLRREENIMLPVILKDGIPPFLDKDNVTSSFHELYSRRDALYSRYADITIDLGEYGDKDEKAQYILGCIKEVL